MIFESFENTAKHLSDYSIIAGDVVISRKDDMKSLHVLGRIPMALWCLSIDY